MLDWEVRWACLTLATLFGAATGARLGRASVTPPPCLGPAGAARTRSLANHGVWRASEPIVRALAMPLSRRLGRRLDARLTALLRSAGYPLGMVASELIAISIVAALVAGAVGSAMAPMLEWSPATTGACACLLGILPLLRIREIAARRARDVERNLPATLDLTALAMDAGLDFAGAIKEVSNRASGRGALWDELSLLLEALRLGHTRRHALRTMADNIPTETVRRFVDAVVQAEERGSPLSPVLHIQAQSLRRHRSVIAEEAASSAALWLTVPMMLLLGCILLVLIGPFLISGSAVAS